jgi:hypothetical protein
LLTANYLARPTDRLEVTNQRLTAALGVLLGGVGPDAVHIVNPQVSFNARVLVAGHPALESVILNWLPSEGHPPKNFMFAEEGGQFEAQITAEKVNAVTIDWNAVVRFKPAGWPDIRQSGKLSVAAGDWSLALAPGAWLTTYTLAAEFVDENDGVAADVDFNDPNTRVIADLAFSSEFLGSKVLQSNVFEPDNEHVVTVAFPNPPGQATPGTAKLTIVAMRSGKMLTASRALASDEHLVAVFIRPTKIDITTANDPQSESSAKYRTFARLAALR